MRRRRRSQNDTGQRDNTHHIQEETSNPIDKDLAPLPERLFVHSFAIRSDKLCHFFFVSVLLQEEERPQKMLRLGIIKVGAIIRCNPKPLPGLGNNVRLNTKERIPAPTEDLLAPPFRIPAHDLATEPLELLFAGRNVDLCSFVGHRGVDCFACCFDRNGVLLRECSCYCFSSSRSSCSDWSHVRRLNGWLRDEEQSPNPPKNSHVLLPNSKKEPAHALATCCIGPERLVFAGRLSRGFLSPNPRV